MRKKKKKTYIFISRFNKIKRKQIRRAIAKKNWRYHHRIIRNLDNENNAFSVKFSGNLYLDDNKEHLFDKLSSAEKAPVVKLSFSNVRQVDIGSMLYIKAFCDFKRSQNHVVEISCLAKNRKMQQILQHMKLKDYGLGITFDDIKCWTVLEWHGNTKENYGKVLMQKILPSVLKDKIPSNEFSRIASGLHELLSNCSEHAYNDYDDFKGYYLIAGEYNNENTGRSNEFTFCIIDMGQGFRASLRQNSLMKKLLFNFGTNTDKDLLKAAVEGKFNADISKNSGRGTGLPAVRKNVDLINGSLSIYSDNGTYIRRHGAERLKNRRNAIIGSIITVTLPIN